MGDYKTFRFDDEEQQQYQRHHHLQQDNRNDDVSNLSVDEPDYSIISPSSSTGSQSRTSMTKRFKKYIKKKKQGIFSPSKKKPESSLSSNSKRGEQTPLVVTKSLSSSSPTHDYYNNRKKKKATTKKDRQKKKDPLLALRDDNDDDDELLLFVDSPHSASDSNNNNNNSDHNKRKKKRRNDKKKRYPRHNTKRESERAQENWQILRQHFQNGHFLLQGAAIKTPNNPYHDEEMARIISGSPTSFTSLWMQSTAPTTSSQSSSLEEMIRQGMAFQLWHCYLAIFLYLIVSILCFEFWLEPEWSMIDSCYYAVTTFTTVGYGDLVPTSTLSIMFTCVYALLGVTCLGIALGIIASHIMETHQEVHAQTQEIVERQVLGTFAGSSSRSSRRFRMEDDGDDEDTNMKYYSSASSRKSMPATPSKKPSGCWIWMKTILSTLPLLALFVGMAYMIGKESEWTWQETLYYTIITGCTVGYGDLVPSATQLSKMLAIVFIPLCVGCMGHWLASIASCIVEAKQYAYFHSQLMKQYRLTFEDLQVMDKDSDGLVTRAEYLEFMLLAMNKVDANLLEELKHHFELLDKDQTGTLTKNDLMEAARIQLQTNPRTKLGLSIYKQYLLKQAQDYQMKKRKKHRHYY